VPLNEQRFGSMELTIGAVRVLDAAGQPVAEVESGEAIQIEIDYAATARIVAPIFCARILREDGVVCYDVSTQDSTLSLSTIEGPGRIALHIDRLDLNSGRYVLDVGCYAQDWAYAYDYHVAECSLVVRGDGRREAVLNAPHRWEIKGGTAPRVVTPAELDVRSSS